MEKKDFPPEELLVCCLRERLFPLFNQVNVLAQEEENPRAVRIQLQTQAALWTLELFAPRYRRELPPPELLSPEELLLPLLQRLELGFIPLDLKVSFVFPPSRVLCQVRRGDLALGLLAAAASFGRSALAMGKKGALLEFKCFLAGEELCLLLEDPLSSLPLWENVFRLPVNPENPEAPFFPESLGWSILEKAAADAGGSCLLEPLSPGIRLLLRLPRVPGDLPPKSQSPAREGTLADWMLAGLYL